MARLLCAAACLHKGLTLQGGQAVSLTAASASGSLWEALCTSGLCWVGLKPWQMKQQQHAYSTLTGHALGRHQQQQQQQQQHQQQLLPFQPLQQLQLRGMSAVPDTHSTTILCIRKGSEVVIMGDGQATQGDFVVKPNVKKVRRIGPSAVGGFAGVAVDGLTLLERLETKLEEHPGQLQRAAVELAKMWRQDKLLRELDASLVVSDATTTLWLMGNGDVLEAEADGVIGIGSGADFAEAAARALLKLQADLQQQQEQHAPAEEAGLGQQQQQADKAGSVAATTAAVEDSASSNAGSRRSSDSGSGSENESTTSHEEVSSAASQETSTTAEAEAAAEGIQPDVGAVAHMSLFDIAHTAMSIAASCCIYTNTNFSWHHIQPDGSIESGDSNSATTAKKAVH